MKTAVRKQVNDLPLEEFFSYLAKLLKTNPPKPEDAPIVARMAKIGIVPGQEFDRSKLPVLGQKLDPKLALLEMVEAMKAKKPVNGWLYWTSNAGTYGTDYEQRAMVTLIGPGLELPAGRGLSVLGEGRATARNTTAPSTNTSCASRRARCRRSRASGR